MTIQPITWFYIYICSVKKMLAKIFFILGLGILLSHQLVSHDHHEDHLGTTADIENVLHTNSFPTHSIDHVFSAETKSVELTKWVKETKLVLAYMYVQLLAPEDPVFATAELEDTPALITPHFTSPSRRGPPAC